MSWVEGRVERVLWAAQDGGWAVLRVLTTEGSMIVVGALGTLADLVSDGEAPFASFEGELEQHPSHGWQFKATGMLLSSPRTEAGVRLYLGSSGVHGIGPAMANRIVAHFGDQTTHVLEKEPERLGEVPGIGAKRAASIAEAWAADAGGRALTILLRGLGLSPRLVGRIRDRFGDDAFAVVTGQPYRLAEEVGGIGFALADRIARGQGLPPDHPDRIAAAVRHVVQRASDDGHCFLPVRAIARGLDRLGVPSDAVDTAVDRLVAEARLEHVDRTDEPAVAVPELADAERLVASLLAERSRLVDDAEVDDLIDEAEDHARLRLDPSQRDAVRRAATAGVSVVTGGPGTGKTTLVRVLLAVAAARGQVWGLASPTGRAAKRLAEATGQEASTLHRLLEFQPGTGRFGRSGTQPLELDGLVVDETSMVDVKLMAAVLDALPWSKPCRLVLVGDADQLPSVGPGQVLRDLVDSGALPVARLAHVHRQGARSGIVAGAAQVHAGQVPVSGEATGHDDFFLVARDDTDAARAALVEIVTRRLPARGFDPVEDVCVLAPTRKGPLGTGELNELLRTALNPTDARIQVGGRSYGVGDRVICTRNRYDLGVFNGDLGRVVQAAPDGLTVRFDDATVPWPRDELDQIELAYAVTVHKSQGSEYPAVVLLLHGSHTILLRRNLFYTAITRARRFFCCVGAPSAWARAVAQQRGDVRHTTLASRLVELLASG
ncbi:MAG: ATP-dependent RecD-like DNA helicase [Alphaproteobacteria bacterium]|nr:ATP-dependent RecD-like DNA helicase [Alphaproteobacteria bacterium]